jgi:hypothetical protein
MFAVQGAASMIIIVHEKTSPALSGGNDVEKQMMVEPLACCAAPVLVAQLTAFGGGRA